jgi:hypothetical protein
MTTKPRSKPRHNDNSTKPLDESQSKRIRDNTFNMRVDQIKTRLDEMRQYKKILAEEGLKPDADDKLLETQLIRRLLWLEKQHANPEGKRLPPKKPVAEEAPKPKREAKPRRGVDRGR